MLRGQFFVFVFVFGPGNDFAVHSRSWPEFASRCRCTLKVWLDQGMDWSLRILEIKQEQVKCREWEFFQT